MATKPAENFQKNLAYGQQAETLIAGYLKRRGNTILPVYDIEYETGKGPRLFGLRKLIAPDALVFGCKSIFWAECKRKTVFSWHRISKRWVTGINREHWEDYKSVATTTSTPVWLFFLHESSRPDARDLRVGCPPECPTGLFTHSLDYLKDHINHESQQWGASGMVYWSREHLKLLARLEEL